MEKLRSSYETGQGLKKGNKVTKNRQQIGILVKEAKK